MSVDQVTVVVNLLKKVGGRDKIYKVAINICKIGIAQAMLEKKGGGKKLQDALNETRMVMRLGGWIENGKKLNALVQKGKVDTNAVLQFFAALASFMYKLLNNLKILASKGVPVKAVGNEKWWQWWQYFFGASVAIWGKDGYLDQQKKIAKGGEGALEASKEATKKMLVATHHTFDVIGNLPNVGYVPGFKPSATFIAACAMSSGAVCTYLGYMEEYNKEAKAKKK